MQFHQYKERVLIVDFGSQFTQLIARRIREIGVFSEIETSPEGLILDRKLFEERKDEWLPSQDDGAFVASLMHAEVRPGYFAGWIAPPKMGIDNKAGDFEFVRIQ